MGFWHKYYQCFRRRFYLAFRRKYVLASIAKRKGECRHCSCCRVTIFGRKYNCKYFDSSTKMCGVYNTRRMPLTCRIYPFDEKDKWEEYRNRCGFYWD